MTDQPMTQGQRKDEEIRQFFEIKTDLASALRASRASDLNEPSRAAIDDDVVSHFNELIVMEMHTDSPILRRACAAVIDGHGFDRSKLPDLTGIDL